MTSEAVASHLADLLGKPVDQLRRMFGGASRETWSFRADGRDLILRRDPPGRPGPAGAMRREAEAMRACVAAGLPVPEVVAYDDGATLGTPGMVMTYVAGETIPRRILRDDTYASARARLTEQLGRFLAGQHRVPAATSSELQRVDSCQRFHDEYDAVDDVSPVFEYAFRRLAADRPACDTPAMVHGDFRLGNVIVDETGLAAVIDWELVHLGDPLEDLAWLCIKAWRYGASGEAAGVGSIDELIASYEDAGGPPVDRAALRWWLTEKTLEWGVMCMLQAAAHLTGASRSVELAVVGRRVAEQEADLLELLEPAAWYEAKRPDHDGGADEPGLYGRPTAAELTEAAGEFLADLPRSALPAESAFLVRVTANALGIVERQLRLQAAHTLRHREGLARLGVESVAALCTAIRGGRLDGRHDELVGFLTAYVRDRLAVSNPRYLNS